MDRYHNAPESGQLTQDELIEVGAARDAWISIKRTFEMWVTIGRGVQRLRAKADAIGGRRTFQRLMDQNGLGELCSPKLKAVTTRLLKIIDNLGPVGAWHASLESHQRVAWASPTSVYRHCPVFAEAKALKPKDNGKRPVRKMQFEIAFDSIVEALFDKPVAQKRAALDRLAQALELGRADEPIKHKAEKAKVDAKPKAPRPAVGRRNGALRWKAGKKIQDDYASYEASCGRGTYNISPGFNLLDDMKFAGYSVRHRDGKTRRQLGSARTVEQAKAIAQRDQDRL